PRDNAAPRPRTARCRSSNACYRLKPTGSAAPAEKGRGAACIAVIPRRIFPWPGWSAAKSGNLACERSRITLRFIRPTHLHKQSSRGAAKPRTRNPEVVARDSAFGALAPPQNEDQAARMLLRNASISERSVSASRRSASEALSTSVAAAPASAEAVETPTMLL